MINTGNETSFNMLCLLQNKFIPLYLPEKDRLNTDKEDKKRISKLKQYIYEHKNNLHNMGKTYYNDEISQYKFKSQPNYTIINNEDNILTCLTVLERDEHLIEILYFRILDSKLFTNEYLKNLEKNKSEIFTALKSAFRCDFCFNNNNIGSFDEYYIEDLNYLVSTLEKYRQNMDLSNNISPMIKTKLYNYQKDNVNWMLKLKKNPVYAPFESSGKLTQLPDGRFFVYDKDNKNINDESYGKYIHDKNPCPTLKVRGGIIMDDTGVGKTLQMIAMILSSNPEEKTLILSPTYNLLKHWNNEWVKHTGCKMPKNITLMTYSEYKKDTHKKYDQVIVDEIHELYSKEDGITQNSDRNYDDMRADTSKKTDWSKLLNMITLDEYKFKWGLTATPFPHVNSMAYLMNFLTCYVQEYHNYTRFKMYYPIFNSLCRRNIRTHINHELDIPPLKEYYHPINFTNDERIAYDTEISTIKGDNDYMLRKCCADVMLNINGERITELTYTEFYANVIQIYKDKFVRELQVLNKQREEMYKLTHEIYKYDLKYKTRELIKLLGIEKAKEKFDNEKKKNDAEKIVIELDELNKLKIEYDELLLNKTTDKTIIKQNKSRMSFIEHEIYKFDKKNKTKYLINFIGSDNAKQKAKNEEKKEENELKIITPIELDKKIKEYTEIELKEKEQKKQTDRHFKAFNDLKDKITKAKQCVICMDDINLEEDMANEEEPKEYLVPECHHTACTTCMLVWLKESTKCGECNQYIDKHKLKKITNMKQLTISYGSKVNKLLDLIKATNDKFVIFTQFEDLIAKFVNIFNKEQISCLTLNAKNIEEFQTNDNIRCIIMSSTLDSFGIQLTSANNIVIFEPVKGSEKYLKDIEKQIIGRINRIGQTKEMNVHRLVVKDTIEEEIYKNSLNA